MESETLDHLSDAQLVHRLAGGDLESLGILFDRHMLSIDRFLWFIGLVPADIEDVVQRTFLRAHLAAGQFDGRVSVKYWLLSMAIAVARRHRQSPVGKVKTVSRWRFVPHRQRRSASAREAATQQLEDHCARALRRLSSSQREVFALVVIGGLSGAEAAMLLECPLTTVWELLHQARIGLQTVVLAADRARSSLGPTPREDGRSNRRVDGARWARHSWKMSLSQRRRPQRLIIGAIALLAALGVSYLSIGVGYTYSLGERAGVLQKLSDRDWACETYEGLLSMSGDAGRATLWKFSVADKHVAEQIEVLVGQPVALRYEQRKRVVSVCSGETEYSVTAVRELQ